ncbi:protein bric-a-brac 1-like isoform X2 [Daphnia pulex]|uniref:protein bric-a-brac 1-like isoform X2 n=1 Tax=Daphnia pulex TaxID=6669 RepID=UPI001EE03CC4|nr:protein bric-a-brac 1-like isoform X2 [Daphnia pulex]XP_046439860.1 protein bric-a-brac 1-like isoform X2 [Daphnia pulex]
MSSKMASTSSSSSSAASGGSSPHLCLRWNNYQSNLTSVFDQLLQNETFVDVTLAADGHAIKAHRMVLSACSPYFQHLFFDNPCQHPIVILKDTRWPELKAIVEYMYRGEISVAQEELTSLLRVAETLKIRGLSELNSDRHAAAAAAVTADDRSESSPLIPIHPTAGPSTSSSSSSAAAVRRQTDSPTWPTLPHHHHHQIHHHQQQQQPAWPGHVMDEEMATTPTPSPTPAPASRSSGVKRRRISGSESPIGGASSPAAASTPGMHHQHHEEASLDHHDGPLSLVGHQQQAPPPPPPPPPHSPVASSASLAPQALTQAPPPPSSLHQHPLAHSDDLDIKPGIAELIREEERARMLEGTHPWLTASPSVLSDTYQYQLQALWQKAWATGQGVMQNLRFRERGPFKTWRPETMAEAIMAVLREGLSLSQAARKFDIPYPTFVLYANRVNNMLGPSADGGPELRPKGRGRPQRILTGSWPEDHVHGVIRAVVFRDPSSLPRHIDREDASKLTANRSAASSSMSRLLTVHPAHQQTIQGELGGGSGSGMRGLIHSAMNNGNSHNYNHEFALPSSSNMTGTFTHGGSLLAGGSAYPSMRSTAGPSSGVSNAANGLMADLMAGATNGSNNNNNNNNMQGGSGSSTSCLSGGGLTSSSLFNALQQEVAEETRLAALNAMTQRLMTSLEGDNFGLGVSCNQQRAASGIQNPAAAAAAAAALEAAAWFGPSSSFSGQLPIVDLAADDVTVAEDDEGDDDDEDAVQHLASFSAHHNPTVTNPVHSKQQEQLFGE